MVGTLTEGYWFLWGVGIGAGRAPVAPLTIFPTPMLVIGAEATARDWKPTEKIMRVAERIKSNICFSIICSETE